MSCASAKILHGDARAVLPTLDLDGAVVITDPPWPSGVNVDIIGAGAPALDLWRDVAALLGRARAVVVYQSSHDPPFAAPPLPLVQMNWHRDVPPSYRGTRILSHVSFVYGDPPRPPGARVWSSESTSHSAEGRAARRSSNHPCPMALDHARWLVRWFGHGCRIIDPFAGHGTVLRAAVEIGQEAIGIECDERWLADARASLAAASSQQIIGSSAEGWR